MKITIYCSEYQYGIIKNREKGEEREETESDSKSEHEMHIYFDLDYISDCIDGL